MRTKTDAQVVTESAPGLTGQDLTGRDRLTWNVLASWAGHLVFVVAGFILPRVIDRQIGQTALGVWDFGWSLVSYFGLASAGVMSSINRYVARHRAAGDIDKVNTTVSTGLTIYVCSGAIVLGLTIFASALVPTLFADRLGAHLRAGQWVVLLLGLSCVVQFVFAVFNGVITGCHRWGLHNAITSGVYVATVSGMILSLVMGGGLRAMSAVVLGGEVVTGLLRLLAAHRVCRGLRLSFGAARLRHAGEMIRFGGKSVLESIARLILYQTGFLLVVAYLGPAALALYARPAALVRHVAILLNKFAYVFTPTASAFQAAGELSAGDGRAQTQSLQELVTKGTQYALYISLPMVLVLALAGGPVLRVWMGERYDQGAVLAILAVGHLALFSQRASYHILMGMERHGLPALAMLAAALCSVPLALIGLAVLEWGLIGAALALVLPLSLVNAIVVPLYACRVLKMSYSRYIVRAIPGPVLAAAPLALCLLVGRLTWPHSPGAVLGWALSVGGAVSAIIYWRYVVPRSVRHKLQSLLPWRNTSIADDLRAPAESTVAQARNAK